MQIIQTIREKGAPITITLIALALIAFILMDARRDSKGPSPSDSIGKINGTAVDQAEFSKKVKLLENQEEQQSGQKPT
ncbi:MAG TPA: SurA N-terminal domain-containing protein, partial [Ferruginibacter sp.]|nr:SurA N-terminal domain-containing protein [Ferruginibacter sp.]